MHSRLEQYLQTVERNLDTLPAEERANELDEIRLHMESLVQANIELGSTEEEAVKQTLAQFGRAQTIGQDLNRAHARGDRPSFRTLVGVIAFNYFVGVLASMTMSGLILHVNSPSSAPSAWWILRGMSTTLFVGWLTGAVMPRHAVRGTLYAHLLSTGISLFALLLLPKPITAIIMTAAYMTMLAATTTIGTALAMFGAKQGARWRALRRPTMRVAG